MNMYNTFWNPRPPSTPTDNYLQSIITEQNLKPDLVAFCSTFTRLLVLASPDAVDTLKEDVTKLLTEVWKQHIASQHPSHWLGKSRLTELTRLFVECGAQAPFVTVYSLYSQGSLDRYITSDISTRSSAARHSSQCTWRPSLAQYEWSQTNMTKPRYQKSLANNDGHVQRLLEPTLSVDAN